jgi:hypothetical protein
MPLAWQDELRIAASSFHAVTTPARDLWHGRIHRADGLSDEEAAWRWIADHEPLARRPLVATDRSVPELGLGRFFGDPSGLSIFRGLADAAFRSLLKGGRIEFEDPGDIPKRDCSAYWLDILYRIAEKTNDNGGVLLARERSLYSLSNPWRGRARRTNRACNVTFAFLERDVFTSSVAAIELILKDTRSRENHTSGTPTAPKPRRARRPRPRWDPITRTLYLGDEIIKCYNRGSTTNQIDIIEKFANERWVQAVDGPFGNARKLSQTLYNLNSTLPPGTIRFRQDGTGETIIWEYTT